MRERLAIAGTVLLAIGLIGVFADAAWADAALVAGALLVLLPDPIARLMRRRGDGDG